MKTVCDYPFSIFITLFTTVKLFIKREVKPFLVEAPINGLPKPNKNDNCAGCGKAVLGACLFKVAIPSLPPGIVQRKVCVT